MYGSRKTFSIDSDLPDDLVSSTAALRLLDRPNPNSLWWLKDQGKLRAYSLGYQYAWSLAELCAIVAERDGAAPVIPPDVADQRISLRGLPPLSTLVSPERAAQLMGVSSSWLRRRTARGEVPCYDLAGARVYSAPQVIAVARAMPHSMPETAGKTRKRKKVAAVS